MALIRDEQKERIKSDFREKLENPVKILMFTQEVECQFCAQTRQLINELAPLDERIAVEVYDFVRDASKTKEYAVDKVPALVVMGEKDFGVRFYGLPYGYELQTLLDAVINVSKKQTDLSDETKNRLKEIKKPVHIQVFVTLTCSYCSIVASLAHKFAIENELIKAEVIDVSEFPQVGLKYGVMGVPKTVINEKIEFVGAFPEDLFLEHILLAAY